MEKEYKTDSIPSDTIHITGLAFVIDDKYRTKFLQDLEFIKKQRDYLDADVYSAYEEINEFLEDNKLPDLKNSIELEKSIWLQKSTELKWQEILENLNSTCYKKLNYL